MGSEGTSEAEWVRVGCKGGRGVFDDIVGDRWGDGIEVVSI